MVRLDAADLLNFQLSDWLFVGNYGECLQHNVCQHCLFRLQGKLDQIVIILFLCAHLICIFQLYDLNAPVFGIIFQHHIPNDLSGGFRIMSYSLSNGRNFNRFSHSKQKRLHSALQMFNFHTGTLPPCSQSEYHRRYVPV